MYIYLQTGKGIWKVILVGNVENKTLAPSEDKLSAQRQQLISMQK